mgnify:FL=1
MDKIYFFADAPHILKLIRNWLTDTGFIQEDNVIINKNPLMELIHNIDSQVSSCHRLSGLHVNTSRPNAKMLLLQHNFCPTALQQP